MRDSIFTLSKSYAYSDTQFRAAAQQQQQQQTEPLALFARVATGKTSCVRARETAIYDCIRAKLRVRFRIPWISPYFVRCETPSGARDGASYLRGDMYVEMPPPPRF